MEQGGGAWRARGTGSGRRSGGLAQRGGLRLLTVMIQSVIVLRYAEAEAAAAGGSSEGGPDAVSAEAVAVTSRRRRAPLSFMELQAAKGKLLLDSRGAFI